MVVNELSITWCRLVVLSVQRISKIIEVCKKVMEQPNANATIKSAHMLVLSVEQICAQVMKRSPADDETLYVRLRISLAT
jgi:hypothetical protein